MVSGSQLHSSGELPNRRNSRTLLEPIGKEPEQKEKKEWSVAAARKLDSDIAKTTAKMDDAETLRLARAIKLMRNVLLLSAFNAWWDWVDASFETNEGVSRTTGKPRLEIDDAARSLAAFRERQALKAAAAAGQSTVAAVAAAQPAEPQRSAESEPEPEQPPQPVPAPAPEAAPEHKPEPEPVLHPLRKPELELQPEPEPRPEPEPEPEAPIGTQIAHHRPESSNAANTEGILIPYGEADQERVGTPDEETDRVVAEARALNAQMTASRSNTPDPKPAPLLAPIGTPADLRSAAKFDDVATIHRLIKQGVDVNHEDKKQPLDSRTALHTAASLGHVYIVRALIDAGAKVEIWDEDGERYPVREDIDIARANYKAFLVVEALEELQELEVQRVVRDQELKDTQAKFDQVTEDRAVVNAEYQKIATDKVARTRMKERVLELSKELHAYDNMVSGFTIRTKQKLDVAMEMFEECEAVVPAARTKLENAQYEWRNMFPPIKAVYPMTQTRSEHEHRVMRQERKLREMQSFIFRGLTEDQLAQRLHEFDRWPVLKEVELRNRYPKLTELQLETCLRVSAAEEWVPLGGKGSVHPGVPLQSETEKRLEASGDVYTLAAARRLAVAKMLHSRLGSRSPWPGLLGQMALCTGRDHVQELCESWILWAWSGDLIIVAGGFVTGEQPLLEDGTLGVPPTFAMPTVAALLAWPKQDDSSDIGDIEGRLRSCKLSCQQAMSVAMAAAAELVEYALPWTEEQKERQRYMQWRVKEYENWARDHTAMATLWRYFYELPREESGITILADLIEKSFIPWGTSNQRKAKKKPTVQVGKQLVVKKKDNLDLVDEFIDLLVVLRENAVDGGWSPPAPRWRPFPTMSTARCNFAMVTLQGGGVLIAGGWDGPQRGWDEGGNVFGSAEVLMPAEQGWRRIADMPTPRHGCTATVLADGKVMVVGGSDKLLGPMRTVEVWDPETGNWRKSTSTFGEHANCGVCTLPDARVLVCGGFGGGRSTEIYDLRTESWTLLADMNHPTAGGRFGCNVMPVDEEGRVMVMGGKGLRSCEQLDTMDNTKECWAAEDIAKKKRDESKMALVAEKESSLSVEERFQEMWKLRETESKAKVVYQRADDTNAPDRQDLSDKYVATKQARKDGIKRHEDAKKAYAMCCAKRTTADQVADTAQKDAESLIKVWSSMADLGTSRFEAAYCQTRDGRILAFGGENNHCQMQDTCEVYEPVNDTWRPLPEGQLLMPLVDHKASLISNGFQGGYTKIADVDQARTAADRPLSQQAAFGKASRLQNQFQVELTEDEKVRDGKPWSKVEEKKLTTLVKLHPGGTEAEWRTIATDLGTHRSHHAVKTHFGWKELKSGKKLRGGLDGRGGGKVKGGGKGKAKAKGNAKGSKGPGENKPLLWMCCCGHVLDLFCCTAPSLLGWPILGTAQTLTNCCHERLPWASV